MTDKNACRIKLIKHNYILSYQASLSSAGPHFFYFCLQILNFGLQISNDRIFVTILYHQTIYTLLRCIVYTFINF